VYYGSGFLCQVMNLLNAILINVLISGENGYLKKVLREAMVG
jgi:hypothetical protein